ncbi:hypothetical protein BKA70DRAFT_1239608 [Coprinopsis sp. MPI-PUGE-AT-0042]|nr:hypothetical protein BKA70DRAFT_1239608 [Coprinopsis sp. MPI-PUGE-AT-0042]
MSMKDQHIVTQSIALILFPTSIFDFMAYVLSEGPKDIHIALVGIHSIGKDLGAQSDYIYGTTAGAGNDQTGFMARMPSWFALDTRETYKSVQEVDLSMTFADAPALQIFLDNQSAQRKSGFYVLSLCIWWMEWADERFNDYSYFVWV